ncbi:hypothetical protein HAX54_051695 [Datura stramonium]|uniref:Uncharacterized protein n=1 Tax=Datura stramonium TaxID=4076 RepID=A0ABS8SY03_DATST|nr:hypothetical protein [Datura stramonium]
MLPAGEPPIPENGVISSSSSTLTSPILDPPLPQALHIHRNTNTNLPENRAAIDILETELLCDQSFSEIIKEEEEEVIGTSDASSTNCTVFMLNERKRLRSPSTDDDEEEDGNNAEAVSDANKLRRIHEAEQGRKEHDDGQNGNQESEQGERGDGGNQESELDDEEGGNQENNNGDEDIKENEETEEEEEEETEELDEGEGEEHEHEEHRKNAGSENNVNHQNYEQNESGNQESEGDEGEEDRENDENQEKSDNDHAEVDEGEEDEEEERKAAEKGKRPMSEICKLKSIVPRFSNFEQGGPSDTPEGNQIHNDSAKNDTELTDHELTSDYHHDADDHQDLAILKSIWHFNCNNGNVPYPHSDVLHNHIMDSIPNLKILREDLTEKIIAFENNFNVVWELDGDNPEMAHPVYREIFDLSMLLWGNSEYNVGAEQQNQQGYYFDDYDDDDWDLNVTVLLNWMTDFFVEASGICDHGIENSCRVSP